MIYGALHSGTRVIDHIFGVQVTVWSTLTLQKE